MRHSLEHAFAPVIALLECARILKPGGFCYVGTPRPDEDEWVLAEPHYIVPTPLQMRNWCAKAGLLVIAHAIEAEQRWLLRRPG
jgi:SAM-dependent methyltransferase